MKIVRKKNLNKLSLSIRKHQGSARLTYRPLMKDRKKQDTTQHCNATIALVNTRTQQHFDRVKPRTELENGQNIYLHQLFYLHRYILLYTAIAIPNTVGSTALGDHTRHGSRYCFFGQLNFRFATFRHTIDCKSLLIESNFIYLLFITTTTQQNANHSEWGEGFLETHGICKQGGKKGGERE